jgi:hypothetical protein
MGAKLGVSLWGRNIDWGFLRTVLRTFGPKREENDLRRKLHNDELHGLYSSPNEVGGTCGTHEEGSGVYRVLVARPEGKRPLGKRRRRWEDNIKMDLRETEKPEYLSGIALGYGLDDRGFESRQGLGILLFTTAYRSALGPTQPPIQWLRVALSLGVKRPGREADHSLLYSAEVKNAQSSTLIPQYAFMAWCSVKGQGQLYLYLLPLGDRDRWGELVRLAQDRARWWAFVNTVMNLGFHKESRRFFENLSN